MTIAQHKATNSTLSTLQSRWPDQGILNPPGRTGEQYVCRRAVQWFQQQYRLVGPDLPMGSCSSICLVQQHVARQDPTLQQQGLLLTCSGSSSATSSTTVLL
jgi:hypothetical protein